MSPVRRVVEYMQCLLAKPVLAGNFLCAGNIDLYYLIDSSTSIDEEVYTRTEPGGMPTFVKNFITTDPGKHPARFREPTLAPLTVTHISPHHPTNLTACDLLTFLSALLCPPRHPQYLVKVAIMAPVWTHPSISMP
jgi:hypothetical protein